MQDESAGLKFCIDIDRHQQTHKHTFDHNLSICRMQEQIVSVFEEETG